MAWGAPPVADLTCGLTAAGADFFCGVAPEAAGFALEVAEDAALEALLTVFCGSGNLLAAALRSAFSSVTYLAET